MIEILGSFPPPYGGVSTHIERLTYYLQKNLIDYIVYNKNDYYSTNVISTKKSLFWYVKYLFSRRKYMVHFHLQYYGFEYLFYFLFSWLNSEKIFITIHNEYLIRNYLLKKIIFFILKRTKYLELIVVSRKISRLLDKDGISNVHIPAYISPVDVKSSFYSQPINAPTNKIMLSCFDLKSSKLFNVYGFDLLFKLIQDYKQDFHFNIFVSKYSFKSHDNFVKLLKKHNINTNVSIYYDTSLINEYRFHCLYIRPYRMDGYGVALQEAMEFDVIALASDVCQRPQGTLVFRNGDYENLYDMFRHVIHI